MARGRRRGPSLLIPMIVLILATLGISYWAVTLVEDIEEERRSLHADQVQIYEVQVAEDQARVRAEQATEWLGFRGASAMANPHSIGAILDRIGLREYDFLNVDIEDDGTRDIHWDTRGIGDNWVNLVELIHRQDETIDLFLDVNSHLLAEIRQVQIDADDAYARAEASIQSSERERDREITDKVQEIGEAIEQVEQAQESVVGTERQLLEMYRDIWTPTTRDTISSLREQRQRVERLRREISEEFEELEQALADSIRARAETEHYDGEIWFVDMERRWAYINLGQRDNVKPGMTFEVQRLQRAERPVAIGMISVRQVIGDFMSWCEITMLQDDDVPMQAGDKVLSRNFARDMQPRFALAGQFGGAYSRFSRHETEEMLRSEGYQIDTEISRHTDIIVLGVNFREDSQFRRIDEGDLADFSETYQFWRPAEVYYMLGFED